MFEEAFSLGTMLSVANWQFLTCFDLLCSFDAEEERTNCERRGKEKQQTLIYMLPIHACIYTYTTHIKN